MSQIVVSQEAVIARPIDVVRRQFVDMTHHQNTRVHSALEVAEVQQSPDGCSFTGRRKMFGKMQANHYEVVRHADGNSTLRSLSGANAGTEIRQTFKEQGPERTLVRVEVAMPATGLLALLAPLVRLGIRKDLAKALEEDKFDLEQRGYSG